MYICSGEPTYVKSFMLINMMNETRPGCKDSLPLAFTLASGYCKLNLYSNPPSGTHVSLASLCAVLKRRLPPTIPPPIVSPRSGRPSSPIHSTVPAPELPPRTVLEKQSLRALVGHPSDHHRPRFRGHICGLCSSWQSSRTCIHSQPF